MFLFCRETLDTAILFAFADENTPSEKRHTTSSFFIEISVFKSATYSNLRGVGNRSLVKIELIKLLESILKFDIKHIVMCWLSIVNKILYVIVFM